MDTKRLDISYQEYSSIDEMELEDRQLVEEAVKGSVRI